MRDAGPDDAGPFAPEPPATLFAALSEQVTLPGSCTVGICDTTLRVEADGDVFLDEDQAQRAGDAPPTLLEDLAVTITSEETTALFAEGCSVGTGGARVFLTREVLLATAPLPELVVQTVEVSGCDDPHAASIRASLAVLRAEVFGN